MRGRQLDVEHLVLGGDERLELGGDLADLAGPALLGEQAHEVADELVGAAEHLLEHVGLDPRVDLRVLEQRGELRAPRRARARGPRAPPARLEAALLLRRVEERAGIDAVRGGYERLASSCEKSISASASSIRRCWSASVSVLRVIFSAASSDRLATSSRIWPSACCGRLLDLALRLLEPALAVLLGLLAHPLALGVGDLARLREDRLGLALRLADQLTVLLEQAARLLAGAVGLLDRLLDPLAAVVDQLLDRAEGVPLQHQERDHERDERPDHQPRDDLDQRVGGGQHRSRRGRIRAGRRGSRRRRRPR